MVIPLGGESRDGGKSSGEKEGGKSDSDANDGETLDNIIMSPATPTFITESHDDFQSKKQKGEQNWYSIIPKSYWLFFSLK